MKYLRADIVIDKVDPGLILIPCLQPYQPQPGVVMLSLNDQGVSCRLLLCQRNCLAGGNDLPCTFALNHGLEQGRVQEAIAADYDLGDMAVLRPIWTNLYRVLKVIKKMVTPWHFIPPYPEQKPLEAAVSVEDLRQTEATPQKSDLSRQLIVYQVMMTIFRTPICDDFVPFVCMHPTIRFYLLLKFWNSRLKMMN